MGEQIIYAYPSFISCNVTLPQSNVMVRSYPKVSCLVTNTLVTLQTQWTGKEDSIIQVPPNDYDKEPAQWEKQYPCHQYVYSGKHRITCGIMIWSMTQKLLPIYGGSHPKSNTQTLYTSWKEDKWGLVNVKAFVRGETQVIQA